MQNIYNSMIQKIGTTKGVFQQYTSCGKGSAVHTRMLQGYSFAEMVRGDDCVTSLFASARNG